jgi:hypothetical protein
VLEEQVGVFAVEGGDDIGGAAPHANEPKLSCVLSPS